MPLNSDPIFGVHAHALSLWSQRNHVLASNIANADTPNYKARDIDFAAALGKAAGGKGLRITTTNAGHMGMEGGSITTDKALYRIPHQPSLDGNSVEVDVEQAEFAQNALRYQASLRFVSGRIKTLRSAITGGQS